MTDLNNDHESSGWVNFGVGAIAVTLWSGAVLVLFCLLWCVVGGYGIFPEPPAIIANHFNGLRSIKEQKLKAKALYADLYSPFQVEGSLQGIRSARVGGRNGDTEYPNEIMILLAGTTVTIDVPGEEGAEYKVGEPIKLFFSRYSETYEWKPLGKWAYYWNLWTDWGNVVVSIFLLLVLPLGCLLIAGLETVCEVLFSNSPKLISEPVLEKSAKLLNLKLKKEKAVDFMTLPKEATKVVVVRTWMFVIMWTICIIAAINAVDRGGPQRFSYWILGGLLLHVLGRYLNLKTRV